VAIPWGLYIHIPFCERRCNYCYYRSFAGAPRGELKAYVDHLVHEATLYGQLARFANRSPRFVYFGGGTPSLLPANDLAALLDGFRTQFRWDSAEEITFECSPKSIDSEKLAVLHGAGVNRISLGVQQLDDEVLRLSARIHLVTDVERAWKEIRSFEFDEVNIDLIAGLPGQTNASFALGLERVIALEPECVTIYQLEVPGNTALFRALDDERLAGRLADWETKRQRVTTGFHILEQHGYRIRNAYSAVRRQSDSHFVYTEEQYRGCDLVGIGLSSFSYVAGMHYQNTTCRRDFVGALNQGKLPITRGYRLNREEQMVREFVLQLKLGHVSREYFDRKFRIDPVRRFAEPLRALAASDWIRWDEASIRLTRRGLVRVDRLLPDFYLPEHQARSYW